jgi:hypothetical protein
MNKRKSRPAPHPRLFDFDESGALVLLPGPSAELPVERSKRSNFVVARRWVRARREASCPPDQGPGG